jgi:hypothetical protein
MRVDNGGGSGDSSRSDSTSGNVNSTTDGAYNGAWHDRELYQECSISTLLPL